MLKLVPAWHSWGIGATAVAASLVLFATVAAADDGVPQCMVDHSRGTTSSSTEYLMHLGEKMPWGRTAAYIECKEPADKSLPTWLVKGGEPYLSSAQQRHGIALPTS